MKYLFLTLSFCFLGFLSASAQSWTLEKKIVASDRAIDDQFGSAVSVWEDYAIIGAWFEDEDTAGANTLSGAGSAYIYERVAGNWVEAQKLVASDRDFANVFGTAVDLFGNYAVIGASWSNTGAAYLFERNGGGQWSEKTKLLSSDIALGDNFGDDVSISGNFTIIGAFGEDEDSTGGNTLSGAGSAYIFERDGGGNWIEQQKLFASDRSIGDVFGESVSISGDYAVVGAYAEDEDAIGADSLSGAGSAYVFERDSNGVWQQVQKIVASDRSVDDQFGRAVAISGNYLVVGAWQEDENVAGGSTLADAGSIYIFERNGSGTWVEVQKLVASNRAIGDLYGFSVDIQGNYLIVGAIDQEVADQGMAYIYERNGIGTWIEMNTVNASVRAAGDNFGRDVGISCGTAVVSAYMEDEDEFDVNTVSNAGSAFFFTANLPATTINATDSICLGDSILLGGVFRKVGGIYNDTLVTGSNCDTVLVTNLSVYTVLTALTDSICPGDSLFVGGAFRKTSGIYYDTLGSFGACDSVIATTLIIEASLSIFEDSICLGDSILIFGQFEKTAGNYYDTLSSAQGCDSVILRQLTLSTLLTNLSDTMCQGDSLFIAGQWRKNSGTYCDTLGSSSVCDSVVCTNLIINNIVTVTQDTICFGDSMLIGGAYRYAPFTYFDSLTTVFGCDSLAISVLSIDTILTYTTATICKGSSILLGGELRSSPGIYSDTLPSSNPACDSFVITQLFLDTIETTIQVFICDGDSAFLGGAFQSTSGTYYDSLTTAGGCDSLHISELSIIVIDITVQTNPVFLASNQANASYQWIDCATGFIIPGQIDQSFNPPKSGVYRVIIYKDNCEDTSACYPYPVGIRENDFGPDLKVFPNPAQGNLYIDLGSTHKEVSVRITDLAGHLIWGREYVFKKLIKLDMSELPGAVYLLHLKSAKKEVVLEIVHSH